ncbi:hypothetical protein HWI79_1525 [Cryptosporidium felis]|nr:hypothetical protein HWI79_1525 [Cryptosporidium felis]
MRFSVYYFIFIVQACVFLGFCENHGFHSYFYTPFSEKNSSLRTSMNNFTRKDNIQLKVLRGIISKNNSVWDLISDLKANMESIKSIRDNNIDEFILEINNPTSIKTLRKLQAKLMQEFDIGKMLWNIDGYSSVLKERILSPKNANKLKSVMQKISDKIQLIIVWNQVYLNFHRRSSSLYSLLLNYFITIEKITLNYSHFSEFIQKYSQYELPIKTRFIIDKLESEIPYLPNVSYFEYFEMEKLDLKSCEIIQIINTLRKLYIDLEGKYREQLDKQVVYPITLRLTTYLIEVRYYLAFVNSIYDNKIMKKNR